MKKKEPAKRIGRPKRVEGEALDRVTLSLNPKLKFGLELLARAHHRSLSQAFEWAIKVGMNSQSVGAGDTTLGDLLDEIWVETSEPARAMAIHARAPELLAFEDSITCELIQWSFESQAILQGRGSETTFTVKGSSKKAQESYYDSISDDVRVLRRFCSVFWNRLKEAAISLSDSGKPVKNQSIFNLIAHPELGEQMKFPVHEMQKILDNPKLLTPKP